VSFYLWGSDDTNIAYAPGMLFESLFMPPDGTTLQLPMSSLKYLQK
ncbi:unnamed protein product, partial [Mesorhabditis belari]